MAYPMRPMTFVCSSRNIPMSSLEKKMICDAGFNEDRTRRLWLLRRWNQQKPCYAYIGLNPSIAGDHTDDPTVKKLMGFTDRFGGGSYILFNTNDLIATDPRDLFRAGKNGNSSENYQNMVAMLDDYKPEKIVLMWGTNGHWGNGAKAVLGMLRSMNIEPWCFKMTTEGHPYHPLYLSYTTQLIRFRQ